MNLGHALIEAESSRLFAFLRAWQTLPAPQWIHASQRYEWTEEPSELSSVQALLADWQRDDLDSQPITSLKTSQAATLAARVRSIDLKAVEAAATNADTQDLLSRFVGLLENFPRTWSVRSLSQFYETEARLRRLVQSPGVPVAILTTEVRHLVWELSAPIERESSIDAQPGPMLRAALARCAFPNRIGRKNLGFGQNLPACVGELVGCTQDEINEQMVSPNEQSLELWDALSPTLSPAHLVPRQRFGFCGEEAHGYPLFGHRGVSHVGYGFGDELLEMAIAIEQRASDIRYREDPEWTWRYVHLADQTERIARRLREVCARGNAVVGWVEASAAEFRDPIPMNLLGLD